MNLLKRFCALFLTAALFLSLMVPALAAVDGTGYSDVPTDAPYAGAVIWCREHELMDGVGGGRFDPDGTLTRAALATVLWRLEGRPVVNYLMRFSGAAEGQWYTEAIRWAASERIMEGYGEGVFGIQDPVTRQDMATILWRYAGEPAAESENSFTDKTDIAEYASAAVDWASANSVVAPTSDGVFDPCSDAARAQIAAALMNFVQNVQPVPQPSNGPKVLIVYFSATNNTESIANHLDTILDADLYEITPKQPYSSADLNYNNTDCRANREQNDASARPAISGVVDNMEQYDVIFLGYPIWWGQAPKIISTFLESYDLSGKTIVPFCTSGSSGIGSSATNLHSLAADATWMDGQRFSGNASRSTVEAWVNGLGLMLSPAA